MATVILDDVSKNYPGNVTALAHVDLRVNDGELLAIVGPSGSGKTTVLRLIAGLDEPSEGRILFDGEDMAGVPPGDRNVAMVHQNGALYAHMSARENIRFPLVVRKVPKRQSDRHVEGEAQHLGIGALLGKRPGELSAGHRHAVATARALIRESRAFLLDEPLASLDAQARERVRVEVARLHREMGATMVYVTNDQTEALAVGERVALLNDRGSIEQVGPPHQIYNRPVSVFAAEFIGRMNLLPTLLEREGDAWWVEVGADRLHLPVSLLRTHPALELHESRGVMIGIRPEHLVPAGPGVPFDTCVHGRVRWVEDLGREVRLHVVAGNSKLEARADPREAYAVNDLVELAADLGRLHFFDILTGLAI